MTKTVPGSRSEHLSQLFSRPAMILVLGSLFALNAVSVDGPIVAISEIAEHFRISKGEAQRVTSLFLMGYALAHIPIGLLGDRFGRRPVILIGMCLGVGLSLAACLAPSHKALLAIRFFQGMTIASGGLLSRAMIRDVAAGRAAAKLTSQALSVLTALIIIVPLLSGLVLDTFGWRYVLGLVFLYSATVWCLTAFFIPETFEVGSSSIRPAQQLVFSVREFFGSPQAIMATLLGSMFFATYFIFATIGASVVKDQFGHSGSVFGVLFAISAAVQFVVAQLNARFVKRAGIARMLLIAASLSAAGIAVCGFVLLTGGLNLITFAVIGCLFSMSHGITLPNAIALTLDPLPRQAGFAASLNGMTQSGLAALISLTVSAFYVSHAGFAPKMFALFGCCNLAVYGFFVAVTRNKFSSDDTAE